MKNLRISHKLWWAVLAIVLALAAVVGTSAARSAATQARSAQVSADTATRVEAALRWAGLTETNAARTQAIIVSTDPALEAEFKDLIAATSAQITEVQKSLEALPLSDADKAQMAAIAATRKGMTDLRTRARQLKSQGQQAEAATLVKQSYNPAVAAYLQALRDFVQLQQRNAVQGQEAVAADRLVTVRMGALAVALLVAAIVAGAYFLIRSIQQPLAEANALAARIAGGDLSAAKTSVRGDEFGELLRSLQTMGDSLGRMVQQVRRSTDSIAIASAEIAAGNQDLSARTEQTSSNLQQTSATMEQFSSTLQQSAGSAREASGLAEGASGVARRGGEVVSQVVATMEEIQQSSRKIEDIIVAAGAGRRGHDGGHRAVRAARGRHDRRGHGGGHAAEFRHRTGEPGRRPPGPDDPAECRAGGRECRGRAKPARAGGPSGQDGVGVPGRWRARCRGERCAGHGRRSARASRRDRRCAHARPGCVICCCPRCSEGRSRRAGFGHGGPSGGYARPGSAAGRPTHQCDGLGRRQVCCASAVSHPCAGQAGGRGCGGQRQRRR
ncbi:hypothetical protein AVHM3334_11310 [Acidovorax sp. SUPP3334]|nr:hypothetical protein AVHM3334_11310 [Acidovorax sp. SUPP3334]